MKFAALMSLPRSSNSVTIFIASSSSRAHANINGVVLWQEHVQPTDPIASESGSASNNKRTHLCGRVLARCVQRILANRLLLAKTAQS